MNWTLEQQKCSILLRSYLAKVSGGLRKGVKLVNPFRARRMKLVNALYED